MVWYCMVARGAVQCSAAQRSAVQCSAAVQYEEMGKGVPHPLCCVTDSDPATAPHKNHFLILRAAGKTFRRVSDKC